MGLDWLGARTAFHSKVGTTHENFGLQDFVCTFTLIFSSHGSSDLIVKTSLWWRMYAAFNHGDVLITLGTGKLTQSEEQGMGLAAEHDYAVIDLEEYDNEQFFLVKNPWSEGMTWKGHPFFSKTSAELSEIFRSSLTPGAFWIGLNDVFQSFESIYLNWNPQLFPYKEDIHFIWDLTICSRAEGSFLSNPQYVVKTEAGGIIWLLLSRHFSSSNRVLAKDEDISSPNWSDPGYISLYAFENEGERVVLNDRHVAHSPYVDSPNTLLKMELPAGKAFTIVISEQALPRSRTRFSLTASSSAPMNLSTAQERYKYSTSQRSAWTDLTAGGNVSSRSFDSNPQFSLHLANISDLLLSLESATENLLIHVKLLWAKGRRVHSITTKDVVGDSGEYRKGFAVATISNVQAGVYTIVCSTFEQGQLGNFALGVKSVTPLTVEEVSRETAGNFVTKPRPAVFEPGNPRLLAPLASRRLNRLSVSAWSRNKNSEPRTGICSPLKLLIVYGQGPSKRILGTSGEDEYLDGRTCARTARIDIQPSMCECGGVWLVIERLACSTTKENEYVEVELLSEGPIELQEWRV